MLDTSYAEEDYAIGMAKGSALEDAVNKALEELKADGTLQAIEMCIRDRVHTTYSFAGFLVGKDDSPQEGLPPAGNRKFKASYFRRRLSLSLIHI